MLARFSAWVLAHRFAVVVGWVVLVSGAALFAMRVPGVVKGGSDGVPGSESVSAVDHAVELGMLPGGFYPFLVVLDGGGARVESPAFAAAAAALGRALKSSDHVAAVRSYWSTGSRSFLGAGGTTALFLVSPVARTFQEAELVTAPVRKAIAAAGLPAGFRAIVTGMAPVLHDLNAQSSEDLLRAERVGLPITLVILLIAFGAPLAAALPLLLAMASVTVSMAVLYLASRAFTVSVFAENTVSMIGLGVGVDYALFVVASYRRASAGGMAPEQAAARALSDAAHTVFFSGAAVAIGFSALLLVRLPFLKALTIGGVCVVLTAMCATLTLLPALLAILGERVNWPRKPRAAVEGALGFWARWADQVMRRPVVFLLASSAILLVFLLPVSRMKPWTLGGSGLDPGLEARAGFDLLDRDFGRGWMGPAAIVIERPAGKSVWEPGFRAAVERLAARWAKDPRVAEVGGFSIVASMADQLAHATDPSFLPPALAPVTKDVASPDGRLALVVLRPVRAPEEPDAMSLTADLRRSGFPELAGTDATVRVSGASALLADFDHEIFDRMWTVVPCVLLLTFVALMWMFRSILVPLKAIAMNLASVLATYGFLVYLFQDGVGASLIGLTPTGGLNSFIVLVLFTILFGLSMDYEVFLLARVKEEYDATGDNRLAVSRGLAGTAGVIGSAALVMVSIFTSFGFTRLTATREFGLGLAFAVALDATLIRLALVPSLLALMGRANWWFPGRHARGAVTRAPGELA